MSNRTRAAYFRSTARKSTVLLSDILVESAQSSTNLTNLALRITQPLDSTPLTNLLLSSIGNAYQSRKTIDVKKDRNLTDDYDEIHESLNGTSVPERTCLCLFGKLARDENGRVYLSSTDYSMFISCIDDGDEKIVTGGRARDYRVSLSRDGLSMVFGTVLMMGAVPGKEVIRGANPYSVLELLGENDLLAVKTVLSLASDTASHALSPKSPYVNGLRFEFDERDIVYPDRVDVNEEGEDAEIKPAVTREPPVVEERRRSTRLQNGPKKEDAKVSSEIPKSASVKRIKDRKISTVNDLDTQETLMFRTCQFAFASMKNLHECLRWMMRVFDLKETQNGEYEVWCKNRSNAAQNVSCFSNQLA
jgi:hypothetical protein